MASNQDDVVRYIRYIGRKPSCRDNVAHSGRVWLGTGDIQPVNDIQAAILVKYPDVWEDVTEQHVAGTLEPLEPPELPPLPVPAAGYETTGESPDMGGVDHQDAVTFSDDLADAVVEAIELLNEEDTEHFTRDGVPRVEAIEELLGRDITAADRDSGWDRIVQAREEIEQAQQAV